MSPFYPSQTSSASGAHQRTTRSHQELFNLGEQGIEALPGVGLIPNILDFRRLVKNSFSANLERKAYRGAMEARG